jgi:periplasmic protein TonB
MNSHDNRPAAASSELGQLERVSRWLVQRAARNSPAALADRLEEEWLADLAAQGGALSRLAFAIGCCWAKRVIARDYLASGAPASSAAAEDGTIVVGQYGPAYFSRRTTIFLSILCLHALVIYGFATGLARTVIRAIPGPMQATIVNQPRAHEPPPPPIESRLQIPTPIISIVAPTFEFPPVSITDTFIPHPPPRQLPTTPPKVVSRILGGPGAGFPNTADYYPLASRRLGEMGVATVRVCVDGRGQLTSAPTIAHSSSSARLDEAALQLAQAGSGHYRSTTEDGMPVTYCYPFRIRFELTQ